MLIGFDDTAGDLSTVTPAVEGNDTVNRQRAKNTSQIPRPHLRANSVTGFPSNPAVGVSLPLRIMRYVMPSTAAKHKVLPRASGTG